jgi:hypothetical protein
MPMSNYPNGFANGVSILGMPVLNAYAGDVYWVNSATGSDGNKGTRDRPFATIDYAIGRCTANNGDIIMVMPNHAETITGAGGITADVAGITIVGLGTFNQRPRFLMDGATTVSFVISAADVTVQNLVFAAGHADIVTCFGITAAGAALLDLEFVNNVVDENFLTPIKATSTTDNNADGLKVIGCRWLSADAASVEFIEVNADLFGLVVKGNTVVHEGTASPLILFATGKDMQYGDVQWNFLSHKMTANELLINIDTTANSGIIAHNRVGHADVTTTHDLGIDGLGCRLFDNLSTSTDSVSGFVLPAIDANS